MEIPECRILCIVCGDAAWTLLSTVACACDSAYASEDIVTGCAGQQNGYPTLVAGGEEHWIPGSLWFSTSRWWIGDTWSEVVFIVGDVCQANLCKPQTLDLCHFCVLLWWGMSDDRWFRIVILSLGGFASTTFLHFICHYHSTLLGFDYSISWDLLVSLVDLSFGDIWSILWRSPKSLESQRCARVALNPCHEETDVFHQMKIFVH